MRKKKKKNAYMCIIESLCCTAEIGTTLQINSTSIEKKKNKCVCVGRETVKDIVNRSKRKQPANLCKRRAEEFRTTLAIFV